MLLPFTKFPNRQFYISKFVHGFSLSVFMNAIGHIRTVVYIVTSLLAATYDFKICDPRLKTMKLLLILKARDHTF